MLQPVETIESLLIGRSDAAEGHGHKMLGCQRACLGAGGDAVGSTRGQCAAAVHGLHARDHYHRLRLLRHKHRQLIAAHAPQLVEVARRPLHASKPMGDL